MAALHRSLTALLLVAWLGAARADSLPTPLEAADFGRYSSSEEIGAYLAALAARAPSLARLELLGHSVQGRPIEALVLARAGSSPASPPNAAAAASPGAARLKLMLVGSQHGSTEPAGGEALLMIARALLQGDLRPLLGDLDLVLIPNANPDGRELKRRGNANRVNINTDFVRLSQPESRALAGALERHAPHAVLDAHESAVFKRSTLAREGYLTDFDAQFEIANNPALPAQLRSFARDQFLPALLARVSAGGLPASRYIGEIVSTRQPLTNGGLTLRNFRNTAGLGGAVSVLVETRLDPRHDHHDSYRNIAVRVQRQLLCIRSFLAEVHARRAAILAHTAAARAALTPRTLTLHARYAAPPGQPTLTLPLRRLDTRQAVPIRFADHRRVVTADAVPYPAALVVTEHTGRLRDLLDRHAIRYRVLPHATRVPALGTRFLARPQAAERVPVAAQRRTTLSAAAGSLLIDLAQPAGRKALLLLDPRSTSSVFRYPEHAALVVPNAEFFVYHATARPP